MRKLTLEQFIFAAKLIHGDKYIYDYVEYDGNKKPVKIWCVNHSGLFLQTPDRHLQGSECAQCSGNKKLTTEQFIEKATKIHGNKYSYIKSIYLGNKIDIEILCEIHGSFWQLPINHYKKGYGCPACSRHKKQTIEDAHNLAKQFGGKCLSVSINNTKEKLKWQCINEHIFEKSFDIISNKHIWCNLCALPYKSEEICRVYFETIFGKQFIKCRPDWLKNNNNIHLELDGYCSELGLAFEHNGEQHYTKGWFCNDELGDQRFDKIQSNDKEKIETCIKNGVKLVIIPQLYKLTKIKELEQLIKDLAISYNIEIKEKYDYDLSHLTKTQFCKDRMSLIQQIAKENEG